MAGAIYEFFGYRSEDSSDEALQYPSTYDCPFLEAACDKHLSNGDPSGACAIKPQTSEPVICCPTRIYADNYRILHHIAEQAWGPDQVLVPGYDARMEAITRRRQIVAVFGKRWGRELRLPKKDGHGNYFVDWILALVGASGSLEEFIALEVQTVDTTGNYQHGRSALLCEDRRLVKTSVGINWENVSKRIIPQLVYKGQLLQRESLAKKGIFFVCPKPVFDRILSRLGGREALPGYPAQHGSITFIAYDYDPSANMADGTIVPLAVVDSLSTTVERLQRAFNDVTLQDANVYQAAIEAALGNLPSQS